MNWVFLLPKYYIVESTFYNFIENWEPLNSVNFLNMCLETQYVALES